MPQNKCQIRNKNGGRMCHAPKCRQLNPFNKQICFIHLKYIYGTAAKIIQNIFRNNRMRHAIDIYKKVPLDIQRKILFHMQENDLIKKHHHNVIAKILMKRCNTLQHFIPAWINANYIPMDRYFNQLFPFLDLIIKYNKVISDDLHVKLVGELNHIDIDIIGDPQFQNGRLLEVEIYNKLLRKLSQYFNLIFETQYREFYNEQILNFINYV